MSGTSRLSTRARTATSVLAAAGLVGAALTALPAWAGGNADALSVQYRTSATGATADQAEPWFQVTNTGSTTVPLSTVTVRYYFRADAAGTTYRFACSWAVKGCANITGTFGTLANPTATADRYLEIGFTAGAGSLAPGQSTGDMQLRFYRSDWQTLRQSDDYSFNGSQTSYASWDKVTLQKSGAVVWGTAPGGSTPTPTPTSTSTPTPTPTQTTGPVGAALFDDFSYTSSSDAAIAQHGWTVKSGQGGPGVSGATWSPQDVTFVADGATNKVMNLRLTTDGTAAGTKETEIQTAARKFKNGTYAARVRFDDTPTGGPDGDHVNQTFFTFTPLNAPMDLSYSEQDFEYLPNGGWGETQNIMYETSWETYNPDPWNAVNAHGQQYGSLDGWHDLQITIDNSNITYFIDGNQVAQHGEPYLPETPQWIDFNHWLIDLAGQTSSTSRSYDEQVDYVYFAKDTVLTPAQVRAQVAAYRTAGTSFTDTVPAS
ncbi:cellulose binding domain-containing protein [Luteimicrobium subarcticum]|uniref:Cellulose binding domain-containing protein n=1 Tax=Luteimicrobium subarcticum TaxID=620910 RepID=A0A2M8WS08_9MICO|nr:cellulose binding domain-containing protein [Luteimicrobium subarcticum]PJI93721.1 cellulose binding domain-containing protein [Luteimicrobium subarcticum]